MAQPNPGWHAAQTEPNTSTENWFAGDLKICRVSPVQFYACMCACTHVKEVDRYFIIHFTTLQSRCDGAETFLQSIPTASAMSGLVTVAMNNNLPITFRYWWLSVNNHSPFSPFRYSTSIGVFTSFASSIPQ
ncbi:hypothetical protein XELAEV_18037304mg [Xenopus laevis]|uniref:Uncharacterized protein n=1 Tax=Xenopus laevis TaxID=8355 RepID=A0A974CD12_XENLA|nr:hypothetical protein XELAEV_18037304mg [Xenopus laevis]